MRSTTLAAGSIGTAALIVLTGYAAARGVPDSSPAPTSRSPSAVVAGSTAAASTSAADDSIKILVSRLDLERYKATIKGLTQFGDRRQGTDRNRAAIDWIESKLKSEGCSKTARLTYTYSPDEKPRPSGPPSAHDPDSAVGGGRYRGERAPTGVNTDPMRQPDEKLRALNLQPSTPGRREEVYCTKVGSTHPEEMYIVGAHMDGHGWGEAANDDGSGTALVIELARIFSSPDVRTERTIRFVLWNNEETGLDGAYAYVAQRASLQGIESPPGSGQYPEPRWLGMIQHDMMLFDHGMPRADGTVAKEQRPEADVNIEFQSKSKQAEGAERLAWAFYAANETFATDYPAAVGPHMTNTDSTPFMDLVPAISLRENERGTEIGAGWDPYWHQPTDLYATFSDQDFRLGLNAAQTTLGAVARLAGAALRPAKSP
jgi:Peptidase family M28